jgi:hypothetical protein
MAAIGGTPVHYLRFDGEQHGALPIVLTHGRPSTFLENRCRTAWLGRGSHPQRAGRPGEDAGGCPPVRHHEFNLELKRRARRSGLR